MTLALFQPGWHWPLVAVAVVVILAGVSAIAVGQADREWLGAHRRELRRVVWAAVFLLVIALLAGQLHKVEVMLRRVQDGDPWWLALGVGFEAVSFLGYVVLTYEMFRRDAPRLNLAACIEITFGGVVATRLFSAGGAGGIAFTTWALRAAGMGARTVARSISAFLAIMYAPFVAACMLGGLGGGAPAAVTWVGVGIGVAAFGAAALLTLIPGDVERRARQLACGHGRLARLAAKLASVPAVAGGARRRRLRRGRPPPPAPGRRRARGATAPRGPRPPPPPGREARLGPRRGGRGDPHGALPRPQAPLAGGLGDRLVGGRRGRARRL